MSRKPRADGNLKTLPEERQAAIAEYARAHTLVETVAWLRGDGITVSAPTVSRFLSWYLLQQQLATNESTVSQVLEDLKLNDPSMSEESLERAGQMFFSALAIQQQDSLTWKRIQDAKLKLGALDLNRKKFQRDTCELFVKWYGEQAAKEIVESTGLSQKDKIEKLGQQMFGELW